MKSEKEKEEGKRKKMNTHCAFCGKEIPKDLGGNRRKYCSTECARCANRNIKKISERVRKMLPIKEQILQAYDCRCAICGWRGCDEPGMIANNGHRQWGCMNQIHHIVPVSKGGKETVDNLILLCPNHHKMADLGIISAEELQKIAKLAASCPVFTAPEYMRVAGSTYGQYWREHMAEELARKGLENTFTASNGVSESDEKTRGYSRGYKNGFDEGQRETSKKILGIIEKLSENET